MRTAGSLSGLDPAERREPPYWQRTLRELAPHDWLVFTYLLVLNVATWRGTPGPAQVESQERVAALLAFLVAVLFLVRGRILRHSFFAPLTYRLAIYGTVQLSYFFMAILLPMVNSRSLDQELYQFDMRVFGVEPAIYLDRIVTPLTTEWFSFFYFAYFFVLALHVIPILMGSRQQRLLGEFALGMLIVFCVGHTLYMVVPGFGPHEAMADQFQRPFPHGMWLDMVMKTVAEGGAQKDIFPSLHTAAPTYIALFSFRHRDKLPFKYTWPIVALFAVNIIGATMFLRWHYVIDVVVGLALSVTALYATVLVTRRELARRAALGLEPSWPTFFEQPAPVRESEPAGEIAASA
ncbi:MAG: phosphatase PAP2 family protein [Sorangiineae bacterium]|nr:phosphatase PAP2 family protein [Polyangiaceae bacterium]MEB2324803.1 phosphatase PAP2 family protein [Sorangiineae bacterium]